MLAEGATVYVHLKSKLTNLINKSFSTRCPKRIIEVITSNNSQEFNYNLSSMAER